jgi:uncharacterized protein YfaQ (DUF2300 family)
MEELKLIMQTLAGLGETAKEGFIWWLVISKLVPTVLLASFGGAVVGLGAYIAKRVADGFREDASAQRAKEESLKTLATIRSILGLYTFPQSRQDTSPEYYTTQNYTDTLDAIRAIKAAADKNAKE